MNASMSTRVKFYAVARGSRGYGEILSVHHNLAVAERTCQRTARRPQVQCASLFEVERTNGKTLTLGKRIGFAVA
jgi:hypothetical protein